MNLPRLFCFCSCLLLAACGGNPQEALPVAPPAAESRPNILLIVADDLGYADLGYYGSEIPTPNLDALAASGMLLTNFHTGLTCSPTRSMLFSGTDSHLAGLGVMSNPRPDQRGQPGYETYLNFRVASLADLMTDAGYNTYMAGKWHLGLDVETSPAARGMKRSFTMLEGGAAHLGGMSFGGPAPLARYREDFTEITVGDDFYSTRDYTQRIINFIETDREEEKPFFAYLAYTAPHWPLQAPDESIDRFAGVYDEGYEVLYQTRFERMTALGILPEGAEPLVEDSFTRPWYSLNDEEKRREARKMEIYAAMVSDLDIYVGELIDYLKSINEFDNTFIMFMADNGAEFLTREEGSVGFAQWAQNCCDNSYENMGRIGSYISYGRNWATASAVPFRRHKGTAFEGGIHVPAFVHYPALGEAGTRRDGFTTVMDLLPTFLALAGTEHPGVRYRGLDVLPVKGTSLLPLLSGQASEVHEDTEMFGWELYGHRSIRQGSWKIVWDAAARPNARWQLFNVVEDPSEQHDLSAEYPETLSILTALWDQYEQENGVIY